MWSPTLYTLSLRAVQLVFSVPVFCYHLGSFSSLRRVASHISFYQFYLRAFKMPMAQSLLRTACAERTYEHFFYSFSHAYVLTRTLAHSVSKTESRDQSMVLYGIAWKKNQIDNHIVAAKWNIFSRGFVLFLWLFHVVDVAVVVVVCTLAGWGSDCSLFIYSLSQAFIDAVHHFYYTVDGLIVDADVDIVDSHALTHSLSISISFSLPPPPQTNALSSIRPTLSLCITKTQCFSINQKVIAITS